MTRKVWLEAALNGPGTRKNQPRIPNYYLNISIS